MGNNMRIFHAGWIIDGTGLPAENDCLLTIDGETVSSVNKAYSGHMPSENLTDLTDCTILPGLLDSHTHLTISGSVDSETRNSQITDAYHFAEPRIKKHINDYIRFGVLAVRDGGDFHAHALQYKMSSHSSKDSPLKIYTAGNGWHKKGRYGQLLGMYLEPGKDLARSIRENYKPGIDHIKIVNSGLNSLKSFGRETGPQFSLDELRRAVDAGNELGLKTMVHANGYEPVKVAVLAGCRSIEHGFFMGDENMDRMAEAGTLWVPTIFTMKAYMKYLSGDTTRRDVAEKNLDHQLQQVRKALEYGVTIALGTDSGSPGVFHGSSVVEELKLLMEAGLSIEKAIQCATGNAFKFAADIENGGILGSGSPATFIAVKGSPEELPGSLYDIRGVWIKGEKLQFS